MKHSRFFQSLFSLIVGTSALGTSLLLPRVALAADPSLDAQMQLGRAFDACEEKNGEKYLELRDFAYSVDPALKSWNGTVQRGKKRHVVQEWAARCDKEMTPVAAKAKRREELMPLYRAMTSACLAPFVDDERFSQWKKAREAYVAKAGNEDLDGDRARCDVEMPKKHAEVKKKEAELAAQIAKNNAETERIAAAARARNKLVAGVVASITGDRRKVLEKMGWPAGAKGAEERFRRAAVWAYDEDIYMGSTHGEEESVDHTARCTVSFQFAGDKLVKTSKSGPGCR